MPAPTPDNHDTFAAAEAELATAARTLVGDPTSGLSKAVNRQLYWHTAALAAGNTTVLPASQATADLAHRHSLPDTPQGQHLRAALTTYQHAWNSAVQDDTAAAGPHDDPPPGP
ncbi:hypothetical protein [Kitasatospora sp. SC0581]|uniref:hypothetical protein n=1 Tax=Kitasatospora sp. SC0581 TaxID=3394360 RepID=UPI003A889652